MQIMFFAGPGKYLDECGMMYGPSSGMFACYLLDLVPWLLQGVPWLQGVSWLIQGLSWHKRFVFQEIMP